MLLSSSNLQSGLKTAMSGIFVVFFCCGIFSVLVHGLWQAEANSVLVADVYNEDFWPCVENDSILFDVHHDDPGIDQAVLTVGSTYGSKVDLCGQTDVCHRCSLLKLGSLHDNQNITMLVNTAFPVLLHVSSSNHVLCRIHVHLHQHGHYTVNVSPGDTGTAACDLTIVTTALDAHVPIYIAIAVFFGLCGLWVLVKFMYRKGWLYKIAFCMPTERLVNNDLGTPGSANSEGSPVNEERVAIPKSRLRSLDTFRGFCLLVMIFVNYKGGNYWFFHHAAWDGLTVADVVFPWFVFIMGTSIAIALQSQLKRGVSRKKLFFKVIRRSLMLFALGLVISNRAKQGREVSLSTLRIPGVLQRLSFSYLVVALMEVFFAQGADIHQHKWWACVRDITPFWAEWLVSLSLLVVHLCLTFLLPVQGCPTGYIGPGGLHDNSSYEMCTGGAAGHIDSWFFGPSHIYQQPTAKNVYLTVVPYDPEGLLGALTSAFLCFLGLQAGKILVYHQDWIRRTKRWLIWSLFTGLIAGTLCKFSQYDGWIPVNKNLWSVSYILAMASMGFFALTLCYLLVDVSQIWSGAPFFYTGMNSIVVYICSEVFSYYFPVQFDVKQTHGAQLAMALWGSAVWVILSVIMYYKKIFIAL